MTQARREEEESAAERARQGPLGASIAPDAEPQYSTFQVMPGHVPVPLSSRWGSSWVTLEGGCMRFPLLYCIPGAWYGILTMYQISSGFKLDTDYYKSFYPL